MQTKQLRACLLGRAIKFHESINSLQKRLISLHAAVIKTEKVHLIWGDSFRPVEFVIRRYVVYMQISHVLTAHWLWTEMLIRDHHYWRGILMLVSIKTIKMVQLVNCCVGGAEPVIGRRDMLQDKMWRRDDGEITKSNVK